MRMYCYTSGDGDFVSPAFLSIRLTVFLLSFLCGAMAMAQTLPGSADPGRVKERLEENRPLEKESLQPKILPAPESQTPPAVQEGFTLRQVTVEGATAFLPAELEPLYTPLLGQKASLETLEFIAKQITRYYQESGYLLSRAVIPAQNVRSGAVRIQVIEGYVSRVRVEGAETVPDRLGLIDSTKQRLLAMRPLHGPTLERYLLALSDSGAASANAVIEALPASNAPVGAVGLLLRITPVTLHGGITVDNFGSRFAGPWEASANTAFSPGFGFDRLSLNALASLPLDEVQFVSAAYDLLLSPSGTKATIEANYSTSTPGYTLAANDIDSSAYGMALRLSHPLILNRATHLTTEAAFEFKDTTTDVLRNELYTDHIRALRLTTSLAHADTWDGTSYGLLRLSHGLDILGARETGSPNLSRAEGHSDFTKLEASLSRVQQIARSWQVYGGVSGQYAWNPLLSTEEFGYGGQSFGRAYDPSEITGDHGLAGSVELRYGGLPALGEVLRFQPFGFYDIGKVWNRDNGIDEDTSGASAGLGTRFFHDNGISGSFYGAVPLTRPADAPPSGNGKSARLLFQLGYSF